jgi:adhesin transport system outer membrane protein
MQCGTQIPTTTVLDRTFSSRPANLPTESVKPAAAVVPVPVVLANTSTQCSELPKTVETWLDAWNRKDVPGYLGAYSANFVPTKGMTRKQWEAMRTARIGKQGDIQITVGKIVPVKCDAQSAEVSFPQEYGSAGYKDKVEKTLSLENVKGTWKITKETVTKGRTY